MAYMFDKGKKMDKKTDTLIIGAGPAGISAAITLQKAGVSNVVIEKCRFPRSKTCGGLVTDKTVSALIDLLGENIDISGVFCDKSNTVEIYRGYDKIVETQTDKALYFVKREVFDNYLVNIYKNIGGLIYEDEKKYEISIDKKCITLSDGTNIFFDHLMAADGALSPVGKKLGYINKKQGFCIETHVDKDKIKDPERVKIFFKIVDKGYAWCFPSGDKCCIGLGGVYSKKYCYTERINELLRMLNISPKEWVLKGAFVPYGKITDQSKGNDDVVLLGDAGGFVDPIYGEGLFFAVSGGIEAAKARIISNKMIRPEFIKRMHPYTKIIKQGSLLQKLFFNRVIQSLIMKKMSGNDSFVRYYCDNMISEYNYNYSKIIKMYMEYKKQKK